MDEGENDLSVLVLNGHSLVDETVFRSGRMVALVHDFGASGDGVADEDQTHEAHPVVPLAHRPGIDVDCVAHPGTQRGELRCMTVPRAW